MIDIIISHKEYENDVYPLIKAFYSEEQVKVYQAEESAANEAKINHATIAGDRLEELRLADVDFTRQGQKNDLRIEINFTEDEITASFADGHEMVQLNKVRLSNTIPRPQYKNAMKRFLYGILQQRIGKSLPWGILTGIRPTKLVYEMLEQGETNAIIHQRMKEEYLCSDEKIDMSIRIARRELELLKQMDYKKGYSLYIGIPFCPTTCLYCSFTSYSIEKYASMVDSYLQALTKEIEYAATCFPNKQLTTVYFGGGTPTTLSADQLDYLLRLVKEKFDFTHVREFCVEAGRPDSITREKLEVLKKWGVDRISINPQSMQQKTLDIIGRRHTIEQLKEAFALARETGHDNINMDIILGLPGECPEDVTDTLRQIKELNPESLTVHTLALKRAARLNLEKDQYIEMKATDVSDMLEETIQFTQDNEYLPYYLYRQKNMADNLENIGYSRYGKEGLYNILIMEEKQTILALGAGGMSKFVFHEENRLERVDNVKSVIDYINRIDEMLLRKRDFLREYGDNL
jgi:oxygen-independent coproporphyrinogen-3 oxidase